MGGLRIVLKVADADAVRLDPAVEMVTPTVFAIVDGERWSRHQPDGGLKPGYLPGPIPFLRILAVSDHEDVRGEHKPLT